jgi:hypothetical protein
MRALPFRFQIQQEGNKVMELNDLSLLDTVAASNAGENVNLTHPATGEPFTNADGSQMYITIAGPDSDRWRHTKWSMVDRRNNLKKSKISGRESDENLLSALVSIVIGWNITLGGDKPPCTPENVRKVFVTYPWTMKQVQAYFDDEANFSKVSSSTS